MGGRLNPPRSIGKLIAFNPSGCPGSIQRRGATMPIESGVFKSRAAAADGIKRVVKRGVSREKISLLTPDSTEREVAAVPVSDTDNREWERPLEALSAAPSGLPGDLERGRRSPVCWYPAWDPSWRVGSRAQVCSA